jgi:chromosome partitioning protein
MRRIVIFNQKGGVGKTVTAINLSAGLAARGRKVLLVDMDPQANATLGLGFDVSESERPDVYDLLVDENATLEKTILITGKKNLLLAPADLDLAAAEASIFEIEDRHLLLKERIERSGISLDYIIIDCPPSLNLLTLNALCASTELFIPIQMSYFALEGVKHLIHILDMVRDELEHDIPVTGVIATVFERTKMSKEVLASVTEHFGDVVFKTPIRRSVKIDEATSHHVSIFDYAPDSYAADDYRRLTSEVVAQEKRTAQVVAHQTHTAEVVAHDTHTAEGVFSSGETTPEFGAKW